MALTYTNEVDLIATSRPTGEVQRVVGCTVTGDSSYPTGGEDLVAADVESAEGALSEIDYVVVASTSGSEIVSWDRANETLQIFTADGTEATNASDQSGVSAELLIFGR